MGALQRINDILMGLISVERRIDPYFRNAFNSFFQSPLSSLVQSLINLTRPDWHLALGEERILADEDSLTDTIIEQMSEFTREHYPNGGALRAGNTKTYGVVRGEFEILPGLADELRQGVFSSPRTFPAWVRFAGPGPLAPPDMDDNGILSIGIKLIGVDGPKLIDDEKHTQDFTGISCPTFTTPNVAANAKLQRHIRQGTPVFYFLNPFDSHYRDAIMQGLYARANTSPLEVKYYSCVPYLFGTGRAAKYSIQPCSGERSKIPWNAPANYLRQAMTATLDRKDVEFDFLVQFQTDAWRMPIEDASVRWPEKLSPFVPVAKLRIPMQKFDSPAQLEFAGNLSYNPWHAIAEHRPLGNQNRARKRIYLQMSKLRQGINRQQRIEPMGEEQFE
ncbi:MAG TPA: catalase family protein [Humisphaera sp.]|nr:catalase family protein [Humisphaera sp.]